MWTAPNVLSIMPINMLKWKGHVVRREITDGLSEYRHSSRKEERKKGNTRNEMGNGSEKNDEARDSNTWRPSRPANTAESDLRTITIRCNTGRVVQTEWIEIPDSLAASSYKRNIRLVFPLPVSLKAESLWTVCLRRTQPSMSLPIFNLMTETDDVCETSWYPGNVRTLTTGAGIMLVALLN